LEVGDKPGYHNVG
jgi:hypothetical protein